MIRSKLPGLNISNSKPQPGPQAKLFKTKVMDEYIALIGYMNKKIPSPICATEVRTYLQELKSARIKVEQEISARHSHQIHQQISKSLIRMITNYGPILPHITPR